jgi:hypothetical protein
MELNRVDLWSRTTAELNIDGQLSERWDREWLHYYKEQRK